MKFKYILSAAIPLLLIGVFDSCSKSSGYSTGGGNTNPPHVDTPVYSIIVKTDSHFGSVITDSAGKSLYFFSLDANGNSACTGNCLVNWPAFYVAGPSFGAGLSQTDFSTITRSDNTKQTTYKVGLYIILKAMALREISQGMGSIEYFLLPNQITHS